MSQMDGNNPPHENQAVGFPGINQTAPKQTGKNWKWLIVLVLFLVVIGGVTFFVFKSSKTASTLEESPTPDTSSLTNLATPEATPTPSSSPSAADKSTIKIQILNGTGVSGDAGVLSDKLKELGYTNITTGNASATGATDTQVTFSSSVASSITAEITSKLNDMYKNVTTGNSALNSYDIQIVVGLRKDQTALPSPTSTETSTSSPTPTPAQ